MKEKGERMIKVANEDIIMRNEGLKPNNIR